MSFAVLFVCTGNICRSPMAERLVRLGLGPSSPVRTFGAGTSGLVGWPMDAPSALVLRELGGDPEGHLAQALTPAHIGAADLVLTAERQHTDAVRALDPRAADRAFTLREFAHFGAGLGPLRPGAGPDELTARVEAVSARRAAGPPLERRRADIGDPYGARLDAVRVCGGQIQAAVTGTIDALGLDRGEFPVLMAADSPRSMP